MIKPLTLAFAVLLAGCASAETLESASTNYKGNKDYTSLEVIHGSLSVGMTRAAVKQLLGEPDYSPIDGQYYYSSDRVQGPVQNTNQPPAPIGLVLDFRDGEGNLSDGLQTFWLGPIGE